MRSNSRQKRYLLLKFIQLTLQLLALAGFRGSLDRYTASANKAQSATTTTTNTPSQGHYGNTAKHLFEFIT
jgi:hypothetical protein